MPAPPDPHWKLRPAAPTPAQDTCSCAERTPVVLQCHLSANPLACLVCNGEVPPERIGVTPALADRVAAWRDFHDAFFTLWLDSGEFESWARAQLEDPASPVNRRGLDLVTDLSSICETYYWWFQDAGFDGFAPVTTCPRCSEQLEPFTGPKPRWLCGSCRIVVAN